MKECGAWRGRGESAVGEPVLGAAGRRRRVRTRGEYRLGFSQFAFE